MKVHAVAFVCVCVCWFYERLNVCSQTQRKCTRRSMNFDVSLSTPHHASIALSHGTGTQGNIVFYRGKRDNTFSPLNNAEFRK